MNNDIDNKNHPVIYAFENVEKAPVTKEITHDFNDEDDFIGLGIELLIEAGSYVCIAVNTHASQPKWNRDTAAVGGNMARLYKLISAQLDQTVQRRRDTSFVIARLTFETIVSIRYLIKNFSPELIDSYVKHSFKHEIRLRSKIDQNIAERGGLVLPIEDRMMKSIDRAFFKAGLEPNDLDCYSERNWGGKNLYEKAEELGMGDAYLGAFAGPSHSVHGAWSDIYSHCLKVDSEGLFSPNIEWNYPRPQLLTASAGLCLFAIHEYIGFISGEELQTATEGYINDLSSRISTLDEGHEHYLASRDWPRIR